MIDYDVVVVGAGAGGGVAACLLSEAGLRVLLIERGQSLSNDEVGRDHLRNQRISLYGNNAGPNDGNPRTRNNARGELLAIKPWEGDYHNNAACVGGGTRVYGAQAWRFMAQDFRMASIYGIPEGSSLADWPISYDDLEPFYTQAENELGVCGNGSANTHQSFRIADYPMPAMSSTLSSEKLRKGAEHLGWNTLPVPLLINSRTYQSRPACVQCQHCVGFACPSNSKNGTHNTVIPRALTTGLCTLQTDSMVVGIEVDSRGQADGVTYLSNVHDNLTVVRVKARAVVVSAGAIETARLMLNSSSVHQPKGIGNENDNVGRNLQGHYYPGSMGVLDEVVYDGTGPGPSIATCQFNHGNTGVIGGGMLANEFIKLPIVHWYRALPPDIPRWGKANKDWMKRYFTRTLHVTGPVQEIPNPEGRVTLNSSVRDLYGMPVAHLSGTTHRETVRTAKFMWERSQDWLKASGVDKLWGDPPDYLGLSGGQHQAGTCRMGADPKTSVTDQWGRVHSQSNVYVMDGSVHVTNGGFNPVLTILALSFRNAQALAYNLK